MSRRGLILSLAILGLAGLVILGSRVGWRTLTLRAMTRLMTASWKRIRLKDGRTLFLDLHDGEMLQNVTPEPLPGGGKGSVAQWHDRPFEKGPPVLWPDWLQPYPGSAEIPRQIEFNPERFTVVSASERTGIADRSYRSSARARDIIEHYRRLVQEHAIPITGHTESGVEWEALEAETADLSQRIHVTSRDREYHVSYLVKQFGRFTPPPQQPILDLVLESVNEAEGFVRLRNQSDGEILRLPLTTLLDQKELDGTTAASWPSFLPHYPLAREIMPAEDNPNLVNYALVTSAPPQNVVDFYRRTLERSGFQILRSSTSTSLHIPNNGFEAVSQSAGNISVICSQNGPTTFCQISHYKRSSPFAPAAKQ